MASVILKSVGAAAGGLLMPGASLFGKALFGTLGASLGNIIDSQLGLGTTITGPRLENLSVQDSRYGVGVATIYGNARVAGNVIWSSDLIETQHTETQGGKGGSSGVTTKTYTYSVHCAVGVCAGPIAGINKIWADSTVIYDGGVWKSGVCDGASIYLGGDDQAADGFMQSILGTGNVPAYKGLAYVVFDNLQLDDFGNRLPNLTFEVAAANVTSDPACAGTTEAAISQRSTTVMNGTMLPIVLESNGSDVRRVLIGGFVPNGSTATFIASEFDVTSDVPAEQTSAQSASFTIVSPATDSSWALSPDGRFVAFYLQSSITPSHAFCIYDIETRTFGAIYTAALAQSSSYKQIAWLDAQHFVIDNVLSNARGLQVFARAGTGIVDLGFTALWGSNSSTTTRPFYGAQFTPYADGLLAYNFVISGATLRARTIAWRDNALCLGDIYAVASGLSLGSGSGPHARFLKTASDEWTLVYGTVLYFCAMSFAPQASSASVTRPWRQFTQDFGTGSVNFPVFYGDRLLIVQNGVYGDTYLISEVALQDGTFDLTVDAAPVSSLVNSYNYFCALKLDTARLLFLCTGGTSYSFKNIAVFERNAAGSVGAVVSDILKRAGYAESDFDVSALSDTPVQGYIVQEPMSARNALEPLQTFAPFDLIETSGQLKAVLRGGAAVAEILEDERRAAGEDDDPPPPLSASRAQELELPREVNVETIDPSRNFEINCQRARRIASNARTVQKISLPVVCGANTAKKVAETKLYTAWAERELIKIQTSRAHLALDPADVVDLGDGSLLRIASIAQSGGLLKIEGFKSYASSLSSDAVADGGAGIGSSGSSSVPSILYLMDAPLLQAADDQPGFYVAVTGLAGWKGATILRSGDGISYASVASMAAAAVAGIATNALPEGSAFYWDNAHSVNVQLTRGELSSCTEADLMNGANAALLGDEIVQFRTATLAGPGLYTLSNLLRGRRGTEAAASTHSVGETFVLLQAGTVTFIPGNLSDRNKAYYFRALSAGQTLSSAQDYAFTYGMKTLCPLSPACVKGARSLGTSGDLTITWARRARLNAEWADSIDVPLDEAEELYEADIMDGDTVVRALTGLTSPTVTYTAAQQASDWSGGVPSSFTVKIYQVSARYGKGDAATATL